MNPGIFPLATEDITGDDGAAPYACTLTPTDLAAQATRWQQLADRAMTERTETAHGLRIAFRAEPGVEEELRRLVAVEDECCSWARWTAETGTRQIVLDVRSTGYGIAVLHGMFTGLDSGGRCRQASPPAPAPASGRSVNPGLDIGQ